MKDSVQLVLIKTRQWPLNLSSTYLDEGSWGHVIYLSSKLFQNESSRDSLQPGCKRFTPQGVRHSCGAQTIIEISLQISCVENQPLRNFLGENFHWLQLCLIHHETLEKAVNPLVFWDRVSYIGGIHTKKEQNICSTFSLKVKGDLCPLCHFRYTWQARDTLKGWLEFMYTVNCISV